MDLSSIKLPIGIIALVIAQGFGVIWYMSGQDSAVAGLEGTVSVLEERIEEMGQAGALPSGERRAYGGY